MVTDEGLVCELAQGNEAALAELLCRYERALAQFIDRHTAGRDVEDLYQETWLRVVRHARRFQPGKRFSTWLFQIAVNLCRDWHRRRKPDSVPVAVDAIGAATMERVEAGLDAARLLLRLPEAQREVVILRYYHDLSEERVAEILECPKGTVKSRMHEALTRLAALVRKEETET